MSETNITSTRLTNATGGVGGRKPKFLYLMICDSGIVKIGISEDPNQRLRQLQTSSAHVMALVETWGPFNSAHEIEEMIHKSLAKFRMTGEWFKIDPETASGIIDGNVVLFVDSQNETQEEKDIRSREAAEYINAVMGLPSKNQDIDIENAFVKQALELVSSSQANADIHLANFNEAIELSDYYQSEYKALLCKFSKIVEENNRLRSKKRF